MAYRLVIFLILNFTSLGLARFLGGRGPKSEWYRGLETAPWTPSVAIIIISWVVTMICLSIYLAYLWPIVSNKKLLLGLLLLHYILSIIHNPIFFVYHKVLVALIVITALTIVIGYLMIYYWPQLKLKSLIIAPYFIWIAIAASLNAYVLFKN